MSAMEELARLATDQKHLKMSEDEIEEQAEDLKRSLIRARLDAHQDREGALGMFRYWLLWGSRDGAPELHEAPLDVENLGSGGSALLNELLRNRVQCLHTRLWWVNATAIHGEHIRLEVCVKADDSAEILRDLAAVLDGLADDARKAPGIEPEEFLRFHGPFPGFSVRIVERVPGQPLAKLESTATGWLLATMDDLRIGAVEGSCLPLLEQARHVVSSSVPRRA